MVTKDDVVEALHSVEDPELGMDIVELGLFYDTEIEGPRVKVVHSLTSMGCGGGPPRGRAGRRRADLRPAVDA
jgi:metal-sulfur cluster biosynthetic enzyme